MIFIILIYIIKVDKIFNLLLPYLYLYIDILLKYKYNNNNK